MLAFPAIARLRAVGLFRRHGRAALVGVRFSAFEPVGVLIDGVGLQRLLARALRRQGALGLVKRIARPSFGCRCGLERALRLVALLAGVVEIGLGLPQLTRLAAAQHAGVDAIALVEALDRFGEALEFIELAAVFLQLVQGFGHVGQEFLRQRRQRLGQRMREAGFVGFFRQLRRAQLDQGVHQGVVARRSEVEQALVHGTPIGACRVEHLAATFDGLAQALTREHDALVVGEPEVAADAWAAAIVHFEHEEPAIDLRARRHRRKPRAQGEVPRRAVFGHAAELDPGIADAPRITVHQQIPRHLLAGIAVGLDA